MKTRAAARLLQNIFRRIMCRQKNVTSHVKVTICNDSGDIASAGCTNTSTRVYIKKSSSGTASDEESSYSAYDSSYAITDEKLSRLCSLHNGSNASAVKPGSQTTEASQAVTTPPNTAGTTAANNNGTNGNTSNTAAQAPHTTTTKAAPLPRIQPLPARIGTLRNNKLK